MDRPGRAVVASAGNEGDKAIHASGSYLHNRILRLNHDKPSESDDEDDFLRVECWVAATDRIDVAAEKAEWRR